MNNDFYDPILDTAGILAEQYGISIADVIGLLMHAGKDEDLVRKVLKESADSREAKAAMSAGKQFDLAGCARTLLDKARNESSADRGQAGLAQGQL
jgi:hypothetical protein